MFDTFELSRFGGKPIRLFRFQRQGIIWRFAQADRTITAGGFDWLPAQIDRDEIKQTSERAKDKLAIRMAYLRDPNAALIDLPTTQALGDLWHPYIPSDKIAVMCLATHYGETDAPVLEWSGEVAQPQYTDVELTLTCVPGKAITEARNQGAKWQRACWKSPYSTGLRGCNLDPAAFEVSGTLTSVVGLTVKAAAFATAPLSLLQGSLSWTRSNGLIERRTITAHTLGSDTVTLLYGGDDLDVATAVVALPNCPGTWAACVERGNEPNYGGAIYKPVENPNGESMSWG